MITDKLLLFIRLPFRGLLIFPSLRERVVPRCIHNLPCPHGSLWLRAELVWVWNKTATNLARLEWMLCALFVLPTVQLQREQFFCAVKVKIKAINFWEDHENRTSQKNCPFEESIFVLIMLFWSNLN